MKNMDAVDTKNSYEPLPKEMVDLLGEKIRLERYRKGEVLFQTGRVCRDIFLLRSGLVKIVKEDSQHREHIISVCGHGNIAGLANLFSDKPQTKGVTLTTSEVCRLDRRDVMEVVEKCPEMMLWILSASAAETERNMERVISLGLPRAKERAAALILSLSDLSETKEARKRKSMSVVLHLSRQELAQMIGISRQHFSMILNELETEGILRAEGRRFEIMDLPKLEALCGQNLEARQPEGEEILMSLYNRKIPDKARMALASRRETIQTWQPPRKTRIDVITPGAIGLDEKGAPMGAITKGGAPSQQDSDVALVNIKGVLDRDAGQSLCRQINEDL